jgi:hypothetical protein
MDNQVRFVGLHETKMSMSVHFLNNFGASHRFSWFVSPSSGTTDSTIFFGVNYTRGTTCCLRAFLYNNLQSAVR